MIGKNGNAETVCRHTTVTETRWTSGTVDKDRDGGWL